MEYFFRAINLTVYLTMLGLGSYLIYQGEVFQKFQAKKTNFAVYTEEIVEIPTMSTYIYPPMTNRIQFQKDFNISLRSFKADQEINLTFGENIVPGTNLRLKFDRPTAAWSPHHFKITPLNFKRETLHGSLLVYRFRKNLKFPTGHQFLIELSTKNNSIPCGDSSYFDGAVEIAVVDIGSHLSITIHPEKYIYHEDKIVCRKNSYLEEIIAIVEKEIISICKKPCRPDSDQMWASCWGLYLSEEISQLPLCKAKDDVKCFIDVVNKAKEKVEEQPCTKLQYRIDTASWKETENEAAIEIQYVIPRKVTVHEKYLLYDLVATIGAIGGTLGLCIGISLKDVAGILLRSMEKLMKKALTDQQVCDGSLSLKDNDLGFELNVKQLKEHQESITRLDTLVNKNTKMITKLEDNLARFNINH